LESKKKKAKVVFSRQRDKVSKAKAQKPSERIDTFALLLSFLEGNAYSLLATVAKNKLFIFEHQE